VHFLRRLPPLFYLGLLPVVCLLWLWADSMSYETNWSYGREWDHKRSLAAYRAKIHCKHIVATERTPGRLAVYLPGGPLGRTGPYGVGRRQPIWAASGMHARDWFPPPAAGAADVGSYANPDFSFVTHFVELPFWLLLLCYLPPWLGLAWWQARRRRKKIAAGMPDANHE